MKKFTGTLLLIFMFVLPDAFAQEGKEMRIEGKPKKLENGEVVARRDANGNYCAAIQIISDMYGFSYDSWNGIVGNVDSKPGKDMVFLTTSERVLEIFKDGYKPLKIILSDYGINLQPREVWQIEISGEEALEELPVVIRYTPDDAQLYVDGTELQEAATYTLAIGKHEVRLVKEGYQNLLEQITVSKDKVLFEWQLEKIKDVALQITSEPEGATVFIDGIKMGETPIAAFYPPGIYPIRIVKDGYVSIEDETIEITAPTTRKDYTLEENVGYLTINTSENATVYFNGEIVENPEKVKLTPQLVKVKVSQPKADNMEQQVLLKKDDDIVLNMYPEVKTGTIQVAVTPFDANVELTGDAGEYYTAEGMKVFEDVSVGTYMLKVSAKGYKSTEKTLILKAYDIVNHNITLVKGNDPDFGIELIFVKGGAFLMGCTEEQSDCDYDQIPVHQVTLDDFYIGKYEVTQKQWKEVMGNNPSHFSGCDDCPVESISWNDTQEFIKKINQLTGKKYRLPTEAEWEYAARGGYDGIPTLYSGNDTLDKVAWYIRNSGHKPHPVGKKLSNELGVFDINGNVSEWCNDWYGPYKSHQQTNPTGPDFGDERVYRGGDFNESEMQCGKYDGCFRYCGVAVRRCCRPDYGAEFHGFRLVHSID